MFYLKPHCHILSYIVFTSKKKKKNLTSLGVVQCSTNLLSHIICMWGDMACLYVYSCVHVIDGKFQIPNTSTCDNALRDTRRVLQD